MNNGYDAMGLITLTLAIILICGRVMWIVWNREVRGIKVGKR